MILVFVHEMPCEPSDNARNVRARRASAFQARARGEPRGTRLAQRRLWVSRTHEPVERDRESPGGRATGADDGSYPREISPQDWPSWNLLCLDDCGTRAVSDCAADDRTATAPMAWSAEAARSAGSAGGNLTSRPADRVGLARQRYALFAVSD